MVSLNWLDMSLSKRWCRCPRDGVGQRSLVLHYIGSQRVGCNSAIDQATTYLFIYHLSIFPPFESSILFFLENFIQAQLMCFDEGGYVTIKNHHISLAIGWAISFMLSLRVKRFELSRRITTQKFKVLYHYRTFTWSHWKRKLNSEEARIPYFNIIWASQFSYA